MKAIRVWGSRFVGLFRRARRERELADELESHLQMHVDDNLRSGMDPERARREAILRLGGVEATKEACRDRSSIPLLETFWRDTRFAMRQLRKSPGFTVTATLMLAIGLCASAALFAFVDAALVKPLPYPHAGRLVFVTESVARMPRANISYPDYLDWKKLNTVFKSFAVYTPNNYLLNTSDRAEPIPGVRVTDGFFRTLGVRPALGRDFYSGEDLPGTPNTVILSYATWQRRFGGAPDAIGQTMRLSGVPHTIVGVLPKTFQFAPRGESEIWIPLHAGGSCEDRRSCHDLDGVARLKDGITLQAALANMTSIAQELEARYPDSNRGQGVTMLSLTEYVVGDIRPIFLMLLGGGLMLLLIAYVNVSSLLLARSEGRRRELAVRRSMGASPARLITQFVTEASVLIAAAFIVGLLLADWTINLFLRLIPEDLLARMPYLQGLQVNLHVLAFAAVTAVIAAIVFAFIPALHLRFSAVHGALAEGSRGSAGVAWRRIGANLVVLELAIAMVLLVGAGLLGRSLNRLLHVDLGFQPDHLAAILIGAPAARYEKPETSAALGRKVVEHMAVLPGVTSVGLVNVPPVSFNGNTNWIRFVGRSYHGEHNEVLTRDVSAGYFKTIQAPLLRGRHFTDADTASGPGVVIINQVLAREYFPGEDPIGKRYGNTSLEPKSIREIVGVVDDIREGPLDSDIWPAEYLPMNQSPDYEFEVIARTAQNERSVLPAMTAAVHQIDPEIGIETQGTMYEGINRSPSAYLHRSSAWLVSGFAFVALLLGIVGLYGVVAYSVSQRTREIGIRMALGAERGNVYGLIMREAGRLTLAGLAGGLVCSLAAAVLMRGLLFGVTSWDLPTLAAVAALLGTAALLASFLPARRAASVNPVDALRAE